MYLSRQATNVQTDGLLIVGETVETWIRFLAKFVTLLSPGQLNLYEFVFG